MNSWRRTATITCPHCNTRQTAELEKRGGRFVRHICIKCKQHSADPVRASTMPWTN